MLYTVIFLLPFEGNNFFRGIVARNSLPFKKNAAYELLKNPRHNWCKFLLTLAVHVAGFFSQLTGIQEKRFWFLMTVHTIDPVRRQWSCWPGFLITIVAEAWKDLNFWRWASPIGSVFFLLISSCARLSKRTKGYKTLKKIWIRELVATSEDRRQPPNLQSFWMQWLSERLVTA